MKIPNLLISNTNGNTLKVACKLYSLADTRRTGKNGYEVCVKQSTLAMSCGLSLSTVKRSLKELSDKNIITNRYRVTYDSGYQGCYHYSLAFFNKYFIMRDDIFEYDLSAQEFSLYAAMSKLRTIGINSFYQSLNDLCRITDIDKSNICKLCKSLSQKGLIYKQLKRTRAGDYTDNTYHLVARLRGRITKRSPKLFKLITHLPANVLFILAPANKSVNRKNAEFFMNKKKSERETKLFHKGGSG